MKEIKVGDRFICYNDGIGDIYGTYVVEVAKITDFNDVPIYVEDCIDRYLKDNAIDRTTLIETKVVATPFGKFDADKYDDLALKFNTFIKIDDVFINVFPNPIFDGELDLDGKKTQHTLTYCMFYDVAVEDVKAFTDIALEIYPNVKIDADSEELDD